MLVIILKLCLFWLVFGVVGIEITLTASLQSFSTQTIKTGNKLQPTVVSVYESEENLVMNSSHAYYHFCEFPVLPVAVYPLNNETGANDVSSGKGAGDAVGTIFSHGIHGKMGGSIEVKGHADSYIELSNSGNLDTKVSITILLYVYPLGSPGPIVNYDKDGHGVQIYQTNRSGMGSLGARINCRDSKFQPEVLKARILRLSEWQFIGVTYNGSTGMVNLWHEGHKVASGRNEELTDIATQFDIRIGARQKQGGSAGECFSGRLACLQFYSTALTALQIDKARIACKPFEPVNELKIVVQHKSKYVEVNETITIVVLNDKNVRLSEYNYSLGDGSPIIITDQDSIHYNYSKHGVFTVVATIYSRCRNETLHISTSVSIEKPVELLANLTLATEPVPFPAPFLAVLISDRGTDFKCYWNFSDGHQAETDFVNHGTTHNLTHLFNATGNYSLHVSCENRLSKANISTIVIVQAPVKGLAIERITPKGYREKFKITWHVQSGSDIQYTTSFAGQELKAFKTINETQGWTWVQPGNHVGLGVHNVIVSASNQVSATLHATEAVRIEKTVEPFSPVLYHSSRYIEVNETFVLFMTNSNTENSANPIFRVNLGDGRGAITTRNLKTNLSYSTYGDFLITINASNNVSFHNTSISIKVHKPVLLVEYLTLSTESTVFLQPTIITVHIRRVSDVVCNASFSDIPNYSQIYDLRVESFWDPLSKQKNASQNPPNVTFIIKRNFTAVGVYSVTVTCQNRLSEKTSNIDTIVQKPVTGARWIPNKPSIFGNPINITLEIASGTNISFEVTFNGYSFIHKNVGLLAFHVIHQDIYRSVGFHRFALSVWNLVTQPIVLHGYAIVEIPIYGLEAYVIGGPRDAEVNESVNIGIRLKNGSYPEFLFDFMDGSEVTVTRNRAVVHKFNPHSLYEVNITARNNVSQDVALLNINVVKPVIPLQKVSISSSPTALYSTACIPLYLSEGSDFSCLWQFGDGSSLNSSNQRLGYYSDGKTTDKRPFQNLKLVVQHIYTSTGIFHISVRCQNRLSSKYASAPIVIQTPVKGLNITKVPIQIVNREFPVNWSLLSGTNVTFRVNISGANISSLHLSELWGFVVVVLASPGKYVIWVEARNLVSPIQTMSAVILAEVPVLNLSIDVFHESRDLEMDQNVTFTTRVKAGTNLEYLFDFGDGSKVKNHVGKVTHKYSYNHVFESRPNVNYEVLTTASNNVSTVTVSINVTVHKPVLLLQKVKLFAYPSNISEQARIILMFDQGSDFCCNCDFGDGKIPRELKLTRKVFLGEDRTPTESFRNQSYAVSYVYNKASKYRLFIECANRLSYSNTTEEIVVQEPIGDLKIFDIAPTRFNETFVISWEIANGTDCEFQITFANVTFVVSGDNRTITVSPDHYKTAGVFKIVVLARNLVSWAAAQKIAVIQFPVHFDQVIASLSQPGGSSAGFSLRSDHFPAGRNITFKALASGTNLSCQWKIDDVEHQFASECLLSFSFYQVGVHNLSVLIKNMVSREHANITVIIHYAIDRPRLQNNSPKKLKQPVKFHLSAKQLGTESCFSVDFGDGTRFLYGHPGCKVTSATSNLSVIPAVESVQFEHVYNEVGDYNVTLNASNAVSFVKLQTDVEVVYAPCTSPRIRIENLDKSSDTASRSFRCDSFTVHTSVEIDCERTNKVEFKWKLISHDRNGVQSTHEVNIIRTERELNIPGKGLTYGLYQVHFTARMALLDTNKYLSTDVGFLMIVPSPLVAKIDGGNLITMGFGKEIRIVGTRSKDPDVETGQDSGLHYTWLCRSIHTQFPKRVYPNMTLRCPYDTTMQPAEPGSVHSVGCYRDGQFIFSSNSSSLRINTARMIENETYVVFLIIQKGGRTAQQYQVIEVVPGEPPVTKIDCKQNCADKINPSQRLALFATCFEGCIGRLIYEWQIYKNVSSDSTESWELVQDIGQSEVKDPTGPVFTVPRDVLEGGMGYRIRLYGRRENGVRGKTEIMFMTNEVPRGGSCFAFPPIGNALMTKFHIWCDGWTDTDAPLSYKFFYKDEEGRLMLFYYGPHNSTSAELPLGNPAHNFTIEIYVKVLDFYKGEASYSLSLQSVEPQMKEDELGDKLVDMTSGENSDLGKLVNVGDAQAALRLVGAVNSLLNAQSSKSLSNNTKEISARKEKRKAVRTAVIKAATSLPMNSLDGLQQSANMIASASKFKDEISTTSTNASTAAFERMSKLLKARSDDLAGYDAVVSGAEALLSGMGYVLHAAGSSVVVTRPKMNATAAPPTCAPYDFTCTESEHEANGNPVDEEETVQLDEESSKSRDAANNIVNMLESVSGSVLENKLPGEQSSVISTAKLNIAVERSDPDSLGGSAIGDGLAGFQMPSAGKLFSLNIDGPVDKQMATMNENPYTWGKKSSDISGKVVSLSFKNKDKKLEVSNLNEDDPIDIFIPRDAPVEPPKSFTYNCSIHHGWRFHKLVIDKNDTTVNVEVGIVGSDRQFEVYVRRGKLPTVTKFDWWKVSPNKTYYEPSNLTLHRESPNATEERTNTLQKSINSARVTTNLTKMLNSPNIQRHHDRSPKTAMKIQGTNVSLFLLQTSLYVGTYYVGIKFTEMPQSPRCYYEDFNITYTLRTFKSKCLYWNDELQKWKSDGCQVGNLTSITKTHCRCTHLTAFGSMMDVAPNPIDFSAVMDGFSLIFDTGNVTVLFFILVVFLIYLLVLVWARRADKRDLEQIGVTPVASSVAFATYHYELTFFTGQRRGAGTTAQVSCLLVGERGDSGICILKDEKRPKFRQGSANAFLISVAGSLGSILSLRVWHDNHGLAPAWFLKRVLVRNLQTDSVTVFICERWFALEEDDGAIMRELTPASEKDLTTFSRVFNSKLYKDFTDAHLWFSVFLKPSRSTFNRAQRASCCLCLLCTAMVTSCIFYGQTATSDESANLLLGPIEINFRSIMISVQCSLVIIPVNAVVVIFFKSVKPKKIKKTKQESEEEGLEVSLFTEREEFSAIDVNPRDEEDSLKEKEVPLNCVTCEINETCSTYNKKQPKGVSSNKFWFFGNIKEKYVLRPNRIDSKDLEKVQDLSEVTSEKNERTKCWCWGERKNDARDEGKEKKKKNGKGFLPHWCLYIAWFLCISVSITSALFTSFYSMQWGKEKSNQWFMSMVLTFSQDTLINQPAKVLLVSVVYAIFIKKSDEESGLEQGDESLRKGEDEEWIYSDHENGRGDQDHREMELLRYRLPDERTLNALRVTRIRQKEIKKKFFSLGDYLFILLVLVLVSYGNRDPASFMMRNSLEQEFMHPLTASYPLGLDDVNNLPLFLQWAQQSLIPYLYEEDWYNGDKVTNRTGFTSGRSSMRLGKIRLRQVRVRNGSCPLPKVIRESNLIYECNPPYDVARNEERMYGPAWKGGTEVDEDTPQVNKRNLMGLLSPWVYMDAAESNSSLTYHGKISFFPSGGYVAEFGNTAEETKAFITYLNSHRWMDRYTRAIFIEGAVYNPNVNSIGVMETVIEFTSANILLPRVNFLIFRLYADLNPSYAFFSACEFIFLGIILYTFYTIIKGIYQRRKDYFRDIVSWLDITFFCDGIAIVVAYLSREIRLRSAISVLKEDQESFLNFSECALCSEELVFLFAFATFIAILKFINFLSFTRCVRLLSTTIFRSVVELQSFAVMLLVIYMAYASMAFTIYGPYLQEYKSISSALGALTCVVMGVFDYTDFNSMTDYKVVGYFFFASFSSCMIFIFTNIVITIINIVHKGVSEDEKLKQREGNFFNFIYDRLVILLGFRGPPKREEPIIQGPPIAELQWKLNVQYMTENQFKRLDRLFNSIYAHDVMEDILLTNYLSQNPGKENQSATVTAESNHDSDVVYHDLECEQRLEANVDVNANQALLTKTTHTLPETVLTSQKQSISTEAITQLIAKKREELRRLQEEGNSKEREILLRVKVIKRIQDLLEKALDIHDSTRIHADRDKQSLV